MKGRPAMMILGIAISVLGLLLIAAFAISRVTCRTPVEATVSRLEKKKTYLRGTTVIDLTPVFTYTFHGQKYTYKAEMSTTSRERFTPGKKETVFINEKHPDKARYGSNLGFLLTGIVVLFIGTAITVLTMM